LSTLLTSSLTKLERSVRVFCQSLDEADRKIREDPKTGLSDDYRRFIVHGRRLLEHLCRLEAKGPRSLSVLRQEAQQRVDHAQSAMVRLSQIASAKSTSEYVGVTPSSVFERAVSPSETDSAATSGNSSLVDTDDWALLVDTDVSRSQSMPSLCSDYDFNPYHFHVPYPQGDTAQDAALPSDRHEAGLAGTKTITDGHANRGNSGNPASPGTLGLSGLMKFGSRCQITHFAERRRWRDRFVADPRISASRETARGAISRAAGGSRQRDGRVRRSEAELLLDVIKRLSPTPMSREDRHQERHRVQSSPGRVGSRLILGRNSYVYADVLAGMTAPGGGHAMSRTEFSNGFSKLSCAPSSWTAQTLKKLNESGMFLPVLPCLDL